jgi:hypothetical protein
LNGLAIETGTPYWRAKVTQMVSPKRLDSS